MFAPACARLAGVQGSSHSQAPKNLWKGYNGKLTVGVLPSSIFCSGHTFFVQVRRPLKDRQLTACSSGTCSLPQAQPRR